MKFDLGQRDAVRLVAPGDRDDRAVIPMALRFPRPHRSAAASSTKSQDVPLRFSIFSSVGTLPLAYETAPGVTRRVGGQCARALACSSISSTLRHADLVNGRLRRRYA
jgi:hypothetical protein